MYEPELGQALFGQPYQEFPAQGYVVTGLRLLGEQLSESKACRPYSPTSNTGVRVRIELGGEVVFRMHAYSWDDDTEQPFNFIVHEGRENEFRVSWYKYIGRGTTMSRATTYEEFAALLSECLRAFASGAVVLDDRDYPYPPAEDDPD